MTEPSAPSSSRTATPASAAWAPTRCSTTSRSVTRTMSPRTTRRLARTAPRAGRAGNHEHLHQGKDDLCAFSEDKSHPGSSPGRRLHAADGRPRAGDALGARQPEGSWRVGGRHEHDGGLVETVL